MTKPLLKVIHRGHEYTRRTARTYTHIVVARTDIEKQIRHAVADAESTVRINWQYWTRETGDNPQYTHNAASMQEMREIVAMGRDGYQQHLEMTRLARIEKNRKAGGYARQHIVAWCGRADLAHKQADKARKDGLIDVEIAEVPS